MKLLIPILCCIALQIMVSTAVADHAPARLSLLQGEVLFKAADTSEWLPAAINTPLHEGDAVWSPDQSRAEVQLPDGSTVRLDAETIMTILSLDSSFLQVHASQGRLFVRTGENREQRLQVDADNTTVIPFGNTRLRIDLQNNGEEDVSIFRGSAYVEGNGDRTRVRAGEQLALEEGGRNEILPLNQPDDWERWNAGIDKSARASGEAARYLPEEIRHYSADLDNNGQWVNLPDYGYVWRPTVILSADWAPYRYGRWAWLRGDYVWIARESWGWAPYHYGRWVITPSFGWCWVPPLRGDVYWGPGFVGWFTTGSRVGWLPLAPGETYYGHGHYGRHSVNVSNVTANNTVVINNYRNYSHQSAITVVERNNFLRGRTVVNAPAREIGHLTVLPGRPQVEPLRETRIPAAPGERKGKQLVFPAVDKRKNLTQYREQFPRVDAPRPRSNEHNANGRTTAASAPVRSTSVAVSAPDTRQRQQQPAASNNAGIAPIKQKAPDNAKQGEAAGRAVRADRRKAWKVYGNSERQEKKLEHREEKQKK